MTARPGRETRMRLERIVGDCLDAAERLKQALDDEHTALAANDAEGLVAAAEAKAEPAARLTALEAERAALSRAAGFDTGLAGMESFIARCEDDSRLAAAWRGLIAVAADCRQQNAANGAVIRLRRQQILAGLAILRGVEPAAETYAATGIEAQPPGSRALTRI